MKSILIISFLTFGIGIKNANANTPLEPIKNQTIQSWVSDHIKYPETALTNKETGTVYVEFSIKEEEVHEVKIIKEADESLNDALVGLIKGLPSNLLNRAINSSYILPIKFNLI